MGEVYTQLEPFLEFLYVGSQGDKRKYYKQKQNSKNMQKLMTKKVGY
jgi:hypothetical protein